MTSDVALLTRWVDRREPQAFKEIVSHYSPMVYATCMRVLGDPHEAEDVVQECFETLVRTPKKPNKHLGAWLHRVATNRSLDRIRSERSRKTREATFAEKQSPAHEATWNDIYDHIDDAIAELPEELRIPLVAYHLRDESHTAIAQSLRISRRTVARRIVHARELLAKSLRRRGVTVSAAALTSLMTSELASAAPVPAGLMATLGKIGLALACAAPVKDTLAVGAGLMTGSSFLLKSLLALAAAGSAIFAAWMLQGTSLEGDTVGPSSGPASSPGGSPGEGSARLPANAELETGTAATDATDAKASLVRLTGRVLDESGHPIAGATVQLAHDSSARAETDTEGGFSLQGTAHGAEASVVASADGYERAQVRVAISPPEGPLILNLACKWAGIAGRVVDLDGKPVPNVEVLLTPQPADDSSWYRQPESTSTQANAAGEFAADNLGPGSYAAYIRCERFTVDAVSDPILLKKGQRLRGVSLVVPFTNETSIEGCVANEDGNPIPEVTVSATSIYGFDNHNGRTLNKASAKTGAQGYYCLNGIVDSVNLVFSPPEESGFAGLWVRNVAPGSTDVSATLLPAGTIRGRVTDAASGKPLHNFTTRIWRAEDPLGNRFPTWMRAKAEKKNERFEVTGLSPGTVTLWISAPNHAGKLLRDIAVAPRSKSQELSIALGPPCILEAPFIVDGHPLKKLAAVLEVHSEEPPCVLNRFKFRHSDGHSTLKMDGIPEGTYLVRGGIANGAHPFIFRSSQQFTATLSAGETTRVEFDFANRCCIRGHVKAPVGSARCVVVVYDPAQVPTRPTDCLIYGVAEYRLTGTGGAFEIPYLDPGEYLVTAYSSEARFDFHRAQSFPLTVEEGDVAEVDFDLVSGPVTAGLPR